MPDEPVLTETPQPAILLPPLPPSVKRVNWVLRALLATLVFGLSSCVACLVVGSRGSAEGAVFATKTVQEIANPWNGDRLLELVAPEFLANTSRDQTKAFVAFVAKRLGNLKEAGAIQNGQWQTFVGTQGVAVFSWHYSDCTFEHGAGRITLGLVRRNGDWKIVRFNVNSDLLLRD